MMFGILLASVCDMSRLVFGFLQNQCLFAFVVENHNAGLGLLVTTFILGVGFIICQFIGFDQIVASGYYFTGSESTITTSFLYLVVLLHLAHVIAGLICLNTALFC